jgi:hypothetical protein
MKKSKKKLTQLILKIGSKYFHKKIYSFILFLRSFKKFKKEINKAKSYEKFSNNIDQINCHEYKITSQNNEDGIIEHIFKKIPNKKYFVEIGFDLYEFNSLNLIKKGWDGKLFEQNIDECLALNSLLSHFYPQNKVDVVNQSINLKNTSVLFENIPSEKDIDFFSIDIDGNDYWIIKKLDLSRVNVICCEYNHFLDKNEKKTVPYSENFNFQNDSFYGASLLALHDLLEKKGFNLIAVDSSGVNAFFVKKKYAHLFEVLSPQTSHRSVGRFYTKLQYNELLKKIKNSNFQIVDEKI